MYPNAFIVVCSLNKCGGCFQRRKTNVVFSDVRDERHRRDIPGVVHYSHPGNDIVPGVLVKKMGAPDVVMVDKPRGAADAPDAKFKTPHIFGSVCKSSRSVLPE